MFELGQFFYNSKFIWDAAITILGFIASIIGLAAVIKASKTVDHWKNKEDYKLQKEREKECEIWVYGELKSKLDEININVLTVALDYYTNKMNGEITSRLYYYYLQTINNMVLEIPNQLTNDFEYHRSYINRPFESNIYLLFDKALTLIMDTRSKIQNFNIIDQNLTSNRNKYYFEKTKEMNKNVVELKKTLDAIFQSIYRKNFLKT